MKVHERQYNSRKIGDLQEVHNKTLKDDAKYIEMLRFFSSVFRMKQKDAFTSCKVVDGIESLPYAIKEDVRQHLLKINNVQISSLNNTSP